MNAKTATEVRMQMTEESHKALLHWITVNQNLIGKEVELTVSRWGAGPIGIFKAEIKEFIPTPNHNNVV